MRQLDESRLLTSADLARPGWRVYPEAPDASRGVASGQPFGFAEVTGVLCLQSAVTPLELEFIEPEAREYAAQEMTAFLRCFLALIRCRVLNPPSAGSLCGPAWRPERWLHLAVAAGVPVAPLSFNSQLPAPVTDRGPESSSVVECTLIGGRLLEPCTERLAEHARSIAAAAHLDLLRIRFTVPPRCPAAFLDADPCPRLADAAAAPLLREYFSRPEDLQ